MLKKVQNVNRFTDSLDKTPLMSNCKTSIWYCSCGILSM